MRTARFPVVLALVAFVAGCGADVTSPDPDLLVRADAPAQHFKTNLKMPINIGVFIPCAAGGAGEVVVLSGNLHVLLQTTINDNSFHAKAHVQPQGISGTGSVTGDTYHGTGVTQSQFNGTVGEEFTFINNFRIIGQGRGNNLLIHETFHVTVNANGEITAEVDNFRSECK